MGFCLYSNVAIGARVAQAAGLARVAVVDFDVHHGNGTQDIFAGEPGLLFASIHQLPGWPGTGDPSDASIAPNVINAGVPAHAPREALAAAIRGADGRGGGVRARPDPGLGRFRRARREPLPGDADQQLEAEDFGWATRAIVAAAAGRARGRVVSSLEGGYDLQALGRSALAHVRALQGV